MTTGSPHFPVRQQWLAQRAEPVLLPEQVIFDAHHHLWDRPDSRYMSAEFLADVHSGHDVRGSLYVQCRTGYREFGPEILRSVGEVQTITQWGAATPTYPIGMVAFADLQLGLSVAPVLDQLLSVGNGRVRGIRNSTAYHPAAAVQSNPIPSPDGLLTTDAFHASAKLLSKTGLCLDVWAYHTQLHEVYEVARQAPELTVVIDHCGGPLGVGPYTADRLSVFEQWRGSLARLASLPNTRIKLGGFGLAVMGYRYAELALPPDSTMLASDWSPYVQTCIELFGPERSMFESNFPVDKGQFSYGVMFNAFKRMAMGYSPSERDDLFWRSAARCYGIDDTIFLSKTKETTDE